MQKVIDFLIRKKDFFVFLLLLNISFSLIFNSSFFHKSKVIVFFNGIANMTKENINNFNSYFELKKLNTQLVEENLYLRNMLENASDNYTLDSLSKATFKYKNARVISNNLSSLKNQLVLDIGTSNGIDKEMGVISQNGIVGIITNSSLNYSSVMSVLNLNSKINAKIKRSSHFGTLEWNGVSTRHLILNDIAETADIRVGDSIITGGMSLIFPEGINVGVVSKIINQNKFRDTLNKPKIENNKVKYSDFTGNYLNIEVRLHTEMSTINNVYVIKSLNREEFKTINK
tara:strand:+ start:383 stop:1243 length:861 start_codon:yes stop_codon:yes gene_type:complete